MNSFSAAGGEVTTVDAWPDATIGEFKSKILQTFLEDDELSRTVTSVELVHYLNGHTVASLQI